MKIAALILAKGKSKRLPGKNKLDFKGKPMFLWNVEKCLAMSAFYKVYVSSDDDDILKEARRVGAIAIKRDENLCGDTPNIPVYQHAVKFMKGVDKIIAVQANSPTINKNIIHQCRHILKEHDEVMTCHQDYSIYGSVWGIALKKLKDYKDPYKPTPEVLLVDTSTDIHTKEDLIKALHE